MKRRSRAKRLLQWTEFSLLLAGVVCLLWVGFSAGQAYFYQSYETYELQQGLTGKASSIAGYLKGLWKPESIQVPMPTPRPAPDMDARQQTPAPNVDPGLIGRVEIPRLNVDVIVREGVDAKTLKVAAGHVPDTALPGNPGNVGIAAHRDTFFRNVRNIRTGDRIMMVTPRGTYEYTVDSLKIVSPNDVQVLDPTPEPVMTLVTCYPFNYIGSAPKRFIVRARQTSTEANLRTSVNGS